MALEYLGSVTWEWMVWASRSANWPSTQLVLASTPLSPYLWLGSWYQQQVTQGRPV
jgi:hypothetical protein